MKLDLGLSVLQKSVLGWIISGPLKIIKNDQVQCNLAISNVDLKESLEKFWQIEESGNSSDEVIYSKEELACEQNFVENVYRDVDGKFVVTLPVRENLANLGESYNTA